MTIQLSDGTTTVELNPDLLWADESEWQPVEQTVERTITGALIVNVATRTGGRPITLQPEDDVSGWISQATVEQLRNWAAVPGKTLTLTLRSSTKSVIFRHHDGVAVDATPVVHFSDVDAADWYRCTIRLMEV
jgi:hypothetical protein